MDLASKDSYMQKFASKVFSQRDQEPRKRPFAKGQNDTGAPKKKKKKCKKKNFKERSGDEKKPAPKSQQKPSGAPGKQNTPAAGKLTESKAKSVNGATAQTPTGGNAKSNFSTVDVLRKRLHEKIEESRGQGAPKNALSEAVQAKRAKRKLERERKKRKRKEFRMKKLAEESGQEQEPEIKKEAEQAPAASKRNEVAIIFNKVETVDEEYVDKILKKKNKKENVKGQITPLTGKNYKQLLSRGKAQELENKMKWTNMLYKAEGLKIKDDEDMLRASLKKKEKNRTQRQKKWNQRSENIVEKMQHRQDKRRRNLLKQKKAKTEKKKNRARKKGRVLPEDLKKAAV
ncbi:surfeit locus protein 6 isoform X2 [Scomber japonicus]|uniref:surfeit locus protein 6 isoform X2 n=1 Tax=Scomber japonicus TaxID=13676 RepID=UPI0023064F4E|nr:surfeit locus protein 6 isoform X2 [Scomber japonicus]